MCLEYTRRCEWGDDGSGGVGDVGKQKIYFDITNDCVEERYGKI